MARTQAIKYLHICRLAMASCVRSVMMVFSAQLTEGGGARQLPFILSTPSTLSPDPEFLTFQGPQASIPRNRFIVINLFQWMDSCRHRFHVEKLKISELSYTYFVCGGRTPLLVNTFPTIVVSYSISGIDFSPMTRSKLPAQQN